MHLHDVRAGSAHQPLYGGDARIADALRFALERQLRVIVEVKTVESLKQSVERLNARRDRPSVEGSEQ